jgi:hypothetical protein
LGWDKLEAVAYARRFYTGRHWNQKLASRVVSVDRMGPKEEWDRIVKSLVSQQVSFGDFALWRNLRLAYDAYVTLGDVLVIPWDRSERSIRGTSLEKVA